jgi:acetyl-CoA/propionyl-CoA carboxylase biotin carboxyl carrier protein
LFDTVLVANRGEIAVRVIRTLRRLGVRSVAVYSDADAGARHVREADIAVRLGPAPAAESYLSIERVLDAARRIGAQAIHPGYGFLSENAQFAAACKAAGVVFVGPPAAAIETMGDKIEAKNAVQAYGVPVTPGVAKPGLSDADLREAAAGIGYPVLVKPSAGGGGKGMHRVDSAAELPAALVTARREAAGAFGDDTLFLERFVAKPRHIEVQVLADTHGNVVHLGERECSLQRRHQKVIEEAPSPLLDAETRARIGAAACETARSVDYVGAGTVEFIVSADAPGEFFFMECNTRLQVEHPVTELVTGLDLVEVQLRIAAGEPLGFGQDDVALTGHAVEARVYAEDPGRGFLPTGGRVLAVHEPAGEGVRIDSSLLTGTTVGSDYDPMLAKVIGYGDDRGRALDRLDAALAQTQVLGVQTNLEFCRFLLADDRVRTGDLDTALLDERAAAFAPSPPPDDVLVAAGLYRQLELAEAAGDELWAQPTGWRVGEPAPLLARIDAPGRSTVTIAAWGRPDDARVRLDDGEVIDARASRAGGELATVVCGMRRTCFVAGAEGVLWVADERGTWRLAEAASEPTRRRGDVDRPAEIASPLPGTVIAAPVEPGAAVDAGNPVVVVEAMKMEHTLIAPVAGTVELLVAVGDQVRLGEVLARLVPDEAGPGGAEAAEKAG